MTGSVAATLRFAQRSGYSLSVLRCVDAGRSASSHDHSNSYSILQRAQLFEGFHPFQRRSFPANETKKQIAPVAVDALVAEMRCRFRGIADERDPSPGKIKSIAALIHHHFHLMRRLGFARIVERMRGGDHLELVIALQFADEPIDQLWIDQRLIALDVHDVGELLQLLRDFGYPVRSARVVRRSHRDFRAPIERRLGDAEVVGRDDKSIELLRATAALPDMSEQRFAGNRMQRLARKSCRAPTRGNYADGFNHLF